MDRAAAEPRQSQKQGKAGQDHQGPRKADAGPSITLCSKAGGRTHTQALGLPDPGSGSPGEQHGLPLLQMPRKLCPDHHGEEPQDRGHSPPALHRAASSAMMRLPGTWPPLVTSRQGPQLPCGSDRWQVPESWGEGGWHTSRTRQHFPPRTLLQEGPSKGRPPFPQPRWVAGVWGAARRQGRLVVGKGTGQGVQG